MRTYSELITLPTFEDRYNYLKLNGKVGLDTFGFDRAFNQQFYHSKEWESVRNYVISRDNGCDLGVKGREIPEQVSLFIHHMNPISMKDIKYSTDFLLNPEYLICVSKRTHDAIHYGSLNSLPSDPIERTANDTCPWKR